MRVRYEALARLAAAALGSWTNEGARLAPSCSPNQGKDENSVGLVVPGALCARG